MGVQMMRKLLFGVMVLTWLIKLFSPSSAEAQAHTGTITGTVTDTNHDILPGAPVQLIQGNVSVTTDSRGEFIVTNLEPGSYTVSVSYLGFSSQNTDVTVAAGQVVNVNIVLPVASQNDQVVVTAGRSYGEAEAINETRASDTIINILPAAVIRSLPNANIADAVGRLPGVTLERDEGEGKYVQIRGTEPRLSNLTIDSVVIPSPEGGIRQVKLDTIPADLVESVQINKTLQANIDADAIGGSVNLVTKTAQERPTLSLYGAGGFTPIITTVPVAEFSGTVGQRFGRAKRLGVIITGSYDYNGRGIDDIEPVPGVVSATDLTPNPSFIAIRSYKYDRTRYGFGGSLDYKLGETSLLYVRGLYSDFMDNGRRWEYQINPGGGFPTQTTERRDGDYMVSSLLVGGDHVMTKSWVNWGVSAARSRMFNPLNGGESITTFSPGPALTSPGTASNCQYDPAATKNVYLPQFTSACFTDAYTPSNLQLSDINQANHGKAAQLNLAAFISAARIYHLGSHASTFELGFKIRNAHKFDDSYAIDYVPTNQATAPLMSMFISGYRNPNYYGGAYKFGPAADWFQVNSYLQAHLGDFTVSSTQGQNSNNFDLVERITAGYIMNTVDFSRFRLIAGLRIEGTQDNTVSFDQTVTPNCLCLKGGGSYVNFLPSASLRVRLDQSSDLRVVYSRALSRPDPQTLTSSFSIDLSTTPPTVNVGNNSLKPELANNYDLLYERYLTPLGLLQAGFFYKQIYHPVVQVLAAGTNATCPAGISTLTPPCLINTPVNAGGAHVAGFEISFVQHFTYLPSFLKGLGLSANYSYATSQATQVDPLRTDSPALLRQAPNTWNISPTFDRGRLSIRVGLAYNGANIFAYAYKNLMLNPDGTTSPNVPPGGINGPSGDQYLFSHFQVDAQGSYRIRKGLSFLVGGLNLNNEPFGFYQGSKQYFIQREFYKPTFTFGFRWEPLAGKE